MFLFGIVHGIESIHVLLSFPIYIVQSFVIIRGRIRTDLQYHRHLWIW